MESYRSPAELTLWQMAAIVPKHSATCSGWIEGFASRKVVVDWTTVLSIGVALA